MGPDLRRDPAFARSSLHSRNRNCDQALWVAVSESEPSKPLNSPATTGDAGRRGLGPRAFERLIQSVVDYAIFMLDEEGRVVSWNPGAERIKGYSADEIIGQHFSRFYTDEDRDAGVPVRALQEALEKGRFTAEG